MKFEGQQPGQQGQGPSSGFTQGGFPAPNVMRPDQFGGGPDLEQGNGNDGGAEGWGGATFSDVKIRHAFIRKVYSLVSLQLLVTTIFVAVIKLSPEIQNFFFQNSWILWLSLIGTVVVMIVLACCESVARSHPINLILLGVFTLLESILVGAISSQYKTDTLLIAAALTTIVVLGITAFAFQTKIDFTGAGIYLFVAGLVLMGFGLVSVFVRSPMMNILYAAGGTALFSFYLVFDTQLMLGGKHKFSISPEDYVMAALNLYVDIVNLFLMILRLVGMKD